jgi:hypothetical protein
MRSPTFEQLPRQLLDALLEVGDNTRRKSSPDEGSQTSVPRRIKEDEPISESRYGRAERLTVRQGSFDPFAVENQPDIEWRRKM